MKWNFELKKAESFNLEIQEAIVRDENGDEIDECEEKSECENVKPCFTVDYKMKIRHRSKIKSSNFALILGHRSNKDIFVKKS